VGAYNQEVIDSDCDEGVTRFMRLKEEARVRCSWCKPVRF